MRIKLNINNNQVSLKIKQIHQKFLIKCIPQFRATFIYITVIIIPILIIIKQQSKLMEDSLEFDYIFKYILVGDTSVGKSSLLASYVRNQFQGNNNPTMGVEFAIKKTEVNGSLVKLQVWDTAGQQSFRTITRAYYKNACGVILVYDLTCPKSIEGLESWVNEIEENSNEKAQIVIVGNKSDLEHSKEQIILPPGISRFKRYITSAKTGNNVNKLFTELTASILAKISTGEIIPDGTHGVKKGNASKGSRNKKLSQYKNNEGEGSGSCC